MRSMLSLNEKQIADYLLRCFTAVDGLWFMKLEDRCGFDAALEIDNEVWKVMPKIQARTLKAMAKMGDGLEALMDCLAFKLSVEGFTFKTEKMENPPGFRIIVAKCPWLDLMVGSGRGELAGKVGTVICNTDGEAWASEFGDDIKFELKRQMCQGSGPCVLEFRG